MVSEILHVHSVKTVFRWNLQVFHLNKSITNVINDVSALIPCNIIYLVFLDCFTCFEGRKVCN